MKVYIGKYKNWFGPSHLVDKLFPWLSEDTRDKIISKIPVKPFNKFYNLRKRKIKVKIHNYDVWSMDHTLSLLIVPMLKQLKKDKQGTPNIDREDVPEHLKEKYDQDRGFNPEVWDWIIDEMIWSFEQKTVDEDWLMQYYTEPEGEWSPDNTGTLDDEGMQKHQTRMTRGFMLFGKYFECLWS